MSSLEIINKTLNDIHGDTSKLNSNFDAWFKSQNRNKLDDEEARRERAKLLAALGAGAVMGSSRGTTAAAAGGSKGFNIPPFLSRLLALTGIPLAAGLAYKGYRIGSAPRRLGENLGQKALDSYQANKARRDATAKMKQAESDFAKAQFKTASNNPANQMQGVDTTLASSAMSPDAKANVRVESSKIITVGGQSRLATPANIFTTDLLNNLAEAKSKGYTRVSLLTTDPKIIKKIDAIEAKHKVKISSTVDGKVVLQTPKGGVLSNNARDKVIADLNAIKTSPAQPKVKIKTKIPVAGTTVGGLAALEVGAIANEAFTTLGVNSTGSVLDSPTGEQVSAGSLAAELTAGVISLPGSVVDFALMLAAAVSGEQAPTDSLGARSKAKFRQSQIYKDMFGSGGEITVGPTLAAAARLLAQSEEALGKYIVTGTRIVSGSATVEEIRAEELKAQIEKGKASAELYQEMQDSVRASFGLPDPNQGAQFDMFKIMQDATSGQATSTVIAPNNSQTIVNNSTMSMPIPVPSSRDNTPIFDQ